MIEYTLESYDLDPSTGTYTRVGEISTYESISCTTVEENIHSFSFNINVFSEDNSILRPYQNWVLVKRNGAPLVFGKIIDLRGSQDPTSGSVEVTCYDVLYSLVNITYEGRYFSSADAGTIASDLISYAQNKGNSDFGIQNGNIETVGDTTETLFYQSIGQAIINQSNNIVGYDFEFVPVLDANGAIDYIQFNVMKASGVIRNNLPPLEIGYAVNVVDFALRDEIYNQIYALGQGTGEVPVASASGTGSQASLGRSEKVIKESSITVQSTLQSKADDELNKRIGVELEVGFELTTGVSPFFGEFGLRDSIPANISIGNTIYNYQGLVRITELNFLYNAVDNKEIITPIVKYYK